MLSERRAPPNTMPWPGSRALAGTLLGQAAHGGEPLTSTGQSRGLAQDLVAADLAAPVVASAERELGTALTAS